MNIHRHRAYKFKICYFLFSSNLVKVVNSLPPRHIELELYLPFLESVATLVIIAEFSVGIAGDRLSLSLTVLVTFTLNISI